MHNQDWLTLNEYSHKYELSISTLRRRIKTNSIEYKLDNGKYFILDQEPKKQKAIKISEKFKKMPQTFIESDSQMCEDAYSNEQEDRQVSSQSFRNQENDHFLNMQNAAEDAFVTAKELLEELKKSYSFILQEKEEQMMYLKNEISDLKTLARVLEEDNTKLRKYIEHLHKVTSA